MATHHKKTHRHATRWRHLTALVGLTLLFDAHAVAHTPQLPSEHLLAALYQGGHVLYLRHGPTDAGVPDQVPVDLADCTTQRPLSAEGRQLIAVLSEQLAHFDWPLHEPIRVSPFCRALDTARAVFPSVRLEADHYLQYTAAMTDSEKAPVIARTRELLSKPVAAGANRVVVAHGPNLADLMDYFPPEGTLVIFLPQGNGDFLYRASIQPDQWPELMKPEP
ncbi:hypothetical protein [Halomonas sp. E19]|uniref:hypothetical protein n=1 Tax=Halomonas sp. E19 TaxID=3397247 RepID=UPI0040349AD6